MNHMNTTHSGTMDGMKGNGMDGMHMGHMYMVVWFDCDAKFIFNEWATNGECSYFMLGNFLTVLFCILHMYLATLKEKMLPKLKISQQEDLELNQPEKQKLVKTNCHDDNSVNQPILKKQSQNYTEQVLSMKYRLMTTCWYFFFSLSNIILMLLMMTMNGYVEIFIALGLGIGYLLFQSKQSFKMETNSCHIE